MPDAVSLLAALTIGGVMCSPMVGYGQPEREGETRLSSAGLGQFEKLWAERTISVGQEFGRPGTFSLGGSGGEGGSAFPLIVRATFMDSVLVEAGIKEFGRLASMTDLELVKYRESYQSAHTIRSNLFVWIELQTPFSEEYLQLDRWTMFLEDENKHQVEPARIVEHPRDGDGARRAIGSEEQEGYPLGGGRQVFSRATQEVELYFPLYRSGGTPLISPNTKSLRLVVVQSDNPGVRAEGSWEMSKFIRR